MKSKIILIVEENEQARKLFEHCIGQLASVESVATAKEGLAFIANKAVDLILVSQQLPDLDGPGFLQKVRVTASPDCPVIATSAFAKEQEKPYFLNQGFADLLTKPIRPKDLILCLQEHLKKETKAPTAVQMARVFDPVPLQQLLKYSPPETLQGIYAEFIQESNELLLPSKLDSTIPITEELLRALHTIKGNSGTLGAEKLFICAKQSEFLGRQGKAVEFAESLTHLKAAITEFETFLKKEGKFYGI